MLDLAPFFAADVPGVVTATVTPVGGLPREIVAHWYRTAAPHDAEILTLIGSDTVLKAPTATVTDLTRGATVTVSGRTYRVTAVHDDDAGITTLEVEPA